MNPEFFKSNGIVILPAWLDRAIQAKNPRVTLGLANSREFKLDQLDKILLTSPAYENRQIGLN